MNVSHPFFFYQLLFKIGKPHIQRMIQDVEHIVLSWIEVTCRVHRMGGKEFLLNGREFGHIHWNGDLDIMMGKKRTAELVKLNFIRPHAFVPAAAITFSLQDATQIPFAVSLLRLSYLQTLTKLAGGDARLNAYFYLHSEALPAELKRLIQV
ncbi:MAG: hypothetical protein C0490_04175 [Marivirga sp.]|nr:hypothetical protein [Marivirga sp.]